MVFGYRTLADAASLMGVAVRQVEQWIDFGPLVAVQFEAGRMIHEDDLRAFRRPLFAVAESESGGLSTFCKLFSGDADSNQSVAVPLQEATERERHAAGRNTLASAGFRALRNSDDVLKASDRFDRLVSPDPNTGCFLWAGAMDRKSYGYFRLTSDVCVFSHRYAYVRANGRIEERLEVDHLCHNRWCVNDRHLEAVSRRENLRRRDARLNSLGTHNMVAAHAKLAHLRLVRG